MSHWGEQSWEGRNHWWQRQPDEAVQGTKEGTVPREVLHGDELTMRMPPHRRFHSGSRKPRESMTTEETVGWRKRVAQLIKDEDSG